MTHRSFSIQGLAVAALCFLTIALYEATGFAGDARPAWRSDWEKSVELAKKESRLVLYAAGAYEQIFRDFQKRFPEIQVIVAAGHGRQRFQQISSERRAGKYLADLLLGGVPIPYSLYQARMLDPIQPTLILPEVADESKWWRGKHKYVDEEGRYIFAFNEVVLPFVAYNTKLARAEEIRSYWDLLHPKWKGKMIALDPTAGVGVDTHLVFIYSHPALGPAFLRRLLGEMDLAASRDERQIVDWLATGKYALSVFTTPSRADLHVAKAQGLPLDWVDPMNLKEGAGTSVSAGSAALLDRAPHPNAAKVALNWLLSREGQVSFQKFQFGSDSLRIDIPKDQVPSFARRAEGVSYVEADNPEKRNKTMEAVRKIIDEAWKRK